MIAVRWKMIASNILYSHLQCENGASVWRLIPKLIKIFHNLVGRKLLTMLKLAVSRLNGQSSIIIYKIVKVPCNLVV